MEKKYVVAGPHGPVAMEENSRRFIGEQPVEIELSSYYRRRLRDGELVFVDAPKAKASKVVTSAPNPESK
jgi:hypothetical protein